MNQFVKAELILIDTELNLEPTLCKFCDKSFPVFYSSLYLYILFMVEVLFLSLSDIYLLFILHFILFISNTLIRIPILYPDAYVYLRS